MGHGNSDKLYITHAEHAGLFGSHSSSTGFKAYVYMLLYRVWILMYSSVASKRLLILEQGHPSTAVLFLFSHSVILSVLETQTVLAMCSTW